jgi:hypothetical protein
MGEVIAAVGPGERGNERGGGDLNPVRIPQCRAMRSKGKDGGMWKMDLTGGVCVSVRRSGEKGKAVVGPLCGPAQVLRRLGRGRLKKS